MSWHFSRRLVDLYREDMQNLPEKIHSKSPGAGVLRGDLSPDQQRRETEGAEDRSPEGQDLQEAPQSGRVFHDVRGQSPVCRGQEDGSGACDDYGTAHSKTPSPGRMRAPHQRHQDGQPAGKSRTSNPCRALTNPREALRTTKEANPRKVCVSLPSSPALAARYLEESSAAGTLSALLSTMPSASAFFSHGRTTVLSLHSLSGMTCERLTAFHGEELLTWFRRVSPAKTSRLAAQPAPDSPAKEAGSIPKSSESLAKYDRHTSSWKILPSSPKGDSRTSWATWPDWGTMRNGECFARTGLGLTTGANAGSLSHPTPTKSDSKGATTNAMMRAERKRSAYLRYWLHRRFPSSRTTYPHPGFMESAMGFPIGWTRFQPVGTLRFQQWLDSHGRP